MGRIIDNKDELREKIVRGEKVEDIRSVETPHSESEIKTACIDTCNRWDKMLKELS